MKKVDFNLSIDKKFYEEMIEPILKDRGIKISKFLIIITKKLVDQGRLSSYAVDSEIFKSNEKRQLSIRNSTEYVDVLDKFREIFAPDMKGQKRTVESNKYLRDEVYGFFYNYSDENMLELSKKYSVEPTSWRDQFDGRNKFIFYTSSNYNEFIKMIKKDYDMNRIVDKYLKLTKNNSYNIYKDSAVASKMFHTVSSNDLEIKGKHMHHCRITVSGPSYDRLIDKADSHFLRVNATYNTILYYVRQNLNQFEDCKNVEESQSKRQSFIRLYEYIMNKYNIKDSNDVRNIIKNIDSEKLSEYIKENRAEFFPIDNPRRVDLSVSLFSMNEDDFYKINSIRKVHSVSWVDIVRVALERDLLKK